MSVRASDKTTISPRTCRKQAAEHVRIAPFWNLNDLDQPPVERPRQKSRQVLFAGTAHENLQPLPRIVEGQRIFQTFDDAVFVATGSDHERDARPRVGFDRQTRFGRVAASSEREPRSRVDTGRTHKA